MLKRGTNTIIALLLTDIALIVLALYVAAIARLNLPLGVHLTEIWVDLRWGVYLMGIAAWLVVALVLSVYTPRRPYLRFDEVRSTLRAVPLSNLLFAGLLYISYRDVPRLLFLYASALQMILLVGFRLLIHIVVRVRHGDQNGTRVLIVGAGKVGQDLVRRISADSNGLRPVGYLDDDPEKLGRQLAGVPVMGTTDQATALVQRERISEVIFALPLLAHHSLKSIVLSLQAMPVRVRVVPDFFDLAFFRATIEDFDGIPLIGLREPAIDGMDRLVKRLFDLTIASLGLAISLPLMALVALAIRLDSPGPVIFRQQRVGENGKLFVIYKFRSMSVSDAARAARAAVELEKRPDDPRVTRVGRAIRRASLDELPQLLNVLKGEMSLVGPRPELPWLVDQYDSWQRKRFAVPPGITGWWQVNGRSEHPMHQHTDDDLYYIQNYSPWLDLRILWRTIGAVLSGRGAF